MNIHSPSIIIPISFLLLFNLLSTDKFSQELDTSRQALTHLGDTKYDSLLVELNKTNHDTAKVNILNDIAWYYAPTKFNKSIKYSDSALVLSKQINWNKGIAQSLKNKGEAFRYAGKIDAALELHQYSLSIFENIYDQIGMISLNSSIGISYYMKSEFPNAYKYYLKALTISTEINYEKGVLQNMSLIGTLFFTFAYYEKALEYYNTALEIAEKNNNVSEIVIQKGNIGLTFVKLNNFRESLSYLSDALEYFNNSDDYYNYAIMAGNMGIAYAKLGNLTLANEYFLNSLDLSIKINDKHGMATQNANLGSLKLDLYLERKKNNNAYILDSLLTEAENRLLNSVNEYSNLGSFDDLKFSYEKLSEVYKEQGKHKKALKYFELSKEIDDSIYSIKNKIKMAEFEVAKNLKSQEQKIIQLSKQNLDQKLTTETLVMTEVFLVVCTFTIFYIYYRRRKYHLLLLNNIKHRKQKEIEFKEDIENLSDSQNTES